MGPNLGLALMGTSMKTDSQIPERLEIEKAELQKHPNRKVTYTAFEHALQKRGLAVGEHSIRNDLNRLQQQLDKRVFRLEIGRTGATLWQLDTTEDDEGSGSRPEVKKRLGIALWEFLLDIDLNADARSITAKYTPTRRLIEKMQALNGRTNVSILVDAGSTTRLAMRELLAVEHVPILRGKRAQPRSERIATDGEEAESQQQEEVEDGSDGLPTRASLLRPSIITNSLDIAREVARSPHFRDIQVRILGGDLRVERASICGPLAEMCIRAWNMHADVAVIGSTGSRRDYSGIRSFGCDDVSEARAKTAMLQMAWLRVLIMDSLKLNQPDVKNIFAPLSEQDVDLVVTDDGSGNDLKVSLKSEVDRFCREAQAAGVATLIVGDKKSQRFGESDKDPNPPDASAQRFVETISPEKRED